MARWLNDPRLPGYRAFGVFNRPAPPKGARVVVDVVVEGLRYRVLRDGDAWHWWFVVKGGPVRLATEEAYGKDIAERWIVALAERLPQKKVKPLPPYPHARGQRFLPRRPAKSSA